MYSSPSQLLFSSSVSSGSVNLRSRNTRRSIAYRELASVAIPTKWQLICRCRDPSAFMLEALRMQSVIKIDSKLNGFSSCQYASDRSTCALVLRMQSRICRRSSKGKGDLAV